MGCCNKNKIPLKQRQIINKIKTNNAVKSNRILPGMKLLTCQRCNTKTILKICPVCFKKIL